MSTKTIFAYLDRMLEPLGFVRHKATWNRRIETFVDVIDMQISKARNDVTINAGVLDIGVHSIYEGRETADVVEEPSCTVRARIGDLIDGKDKWWQIDKSHEAAEDMATQVANRVLPFFERLHSTEAMVTWLTEANVMTKQYPPPIIYLAILHHYLGDNSKPCELLADLLAKTTSPWKPKVKDVMERMGCS